MNFPLRKILSMKISLLIKSSKTKEFIKKFMKT